MEGKLWQTGRFKKQDITLLTNVQCKNWTSKEGWHWRNWLTTIWRALKSSLVLDYKIKPTNLKKSTWKFFAKTDASAEAHADHLMWRRRLTGKDLMLERLKAKEKRGGWRGDSEHHCELVEPGDQAARNRRTIETFRDSHEITSSSFNFIWLNKNKRKIS